MRELRTARCPAGVSLTFAVVVGLSDLQKPKDAGHAAQTRVSIGLLQTEYHALEQVQHSLVHLSTDLLQQ